MNPQQPGQKAVTSALHPFKAVRMGFWGGHRLPTSLLAGRSGTARPSQSCRQLGITQGHRGCGPAWPRECQESGTGLPGMPGHGHREGTLLCLEIKLFTERKKKASLWKERNKLPSQVIHLGSVGVKMIHVFQFTPSSNLK